MQGDNNAMRRNTCDRLAAGARKCRYHLCSGPLSLRRGVHSALINVALQLELMCKQLQLEQLGNTLSTATHAHTGGTMEGICSTEISFKMLWFVQCFETGLCTGLSRVVFPTADWELHRSCLLF